MDEGGLDRRHRAGGVIQGEVGVILKRSMVRLFSVGPQCPNMVAILAAVS
jgi:hypothetical protein